MPLVKQCSSEAQNSWDFQLISSVIRLKTWLYRNYLSKWAYIILLLLLLLLSSSSVCMVIFHHSSVIICHFWLAYIADIAHYIFVCKLCFEIIFSIKNHTFTRYSIYLKLPWFINMKSSKSIHIHWKENILGCIIFVQSEIRTASYRFILPIIIFLQKWICSVVTFPPHDHMRLWGNKILPPLSERGGGGRVKNYWKQIIYFFMCMF